MLFHFKRPHRQWKLRYTFVYNGSEVVEEERFLTREEAEERFGAMSAYHAKRQEVILNAQLTGPNGLRQDLLLAAKPPHFQPLPSKPSLSQRSG